MGLGSHGGSVGVPGSGASFVQSASCGYQAEHGAVCAGWRVERVVIVSVVEAVTRDLDLIRRRSPELADSAMAATALAMARELDDVAAEQACEECGHVQSWTQQGNSATSKSMCAKALLEVMEQLRELAPPAQKETDLDKVRARRASRRAGIAAS